jgi:hypothetical protein
MKGIEGIKNELNRPLNVSLQILTFRGRYFYGKYSF